MQRRRLSRKKRVISGLCSCDGEQSQHGAFQTELASGRIVPFLERMRAAALPASADRDCGDALRERKVRVGGRAFKARTIAEIAVRVFNGGKERRIRDQSSAGAYADDRHFEFEGFISRFRRGHFLVDSTGKCLTQVAFEARQLDRKSVV